MTVDLFRDRDFWLRYHVVDEDLQLEDEHRFVLPWSDRFAFRIEASDSGLTLYLDDETTAHQLGWWDEARWHPYALRWCELQTLLRGWASRPDTPAAPAPLLLLCSFVGFGVDDAKDYQEAQRLVTDAYRSLGFGPLDISRLTEHSLPVAGNEDYRWLRDPELGWLYRGEYPCYSLRNRDHGCGGSNFPFALFKELFSDDKD